MANKSLISKNPIARIQLGHSGGHLTTRSWLDFQSDFLQAKDALQSNYDLHKIDEFCKENHLPTITCESQANSLQLFLLRPDLGKCLSTETKTILQDIHHREDLLIIISGGLAPLAIANHAIPFLKIFLPLMSKQQWQCAPILLFPRSRVAIGDQANHFLKAKCVMILIGERPGLSSADSMGIYFTYQAHLKSNDSQRNCISNIHAKGMSYQDAAQKSIHILKKAFEEGYTGIDS